MLAVVLVVLVIYLFLRNLPATTIPSVAVPLSLVGTFGVMYLLGFSLNNLSLMALTISTGFVVDDAIVMIENISRYVEEGETPMRGGAQGCKADRVHHPLSHCFAHRGAYPAPFHGRRGRTSLPGVRHDPRRHHPHFGVVSLTLTPMMCARILKHVPEEKQGRFYHASAALFRPDHCGLRKDLAMGAQAPDSDACRGGGYAGPDRAALYHRSEGLFPGPGRRERSRACRRRPKSSPSRPWPSDSRPLPA